LPPQRLPAHETVFAMTVHKSQGSEFDSVLVILPENESPLLTRELLYTAVTRAREKVLIWGPEGGLTAAVSKKIERASGLHDALWHGTHEK
jgi:exodeoxyribonuclease V alpha subunit